MVKRSTRSMVLMLACAFTASVALAQNAYKKLDGEVHTGFRFGSLSAQARSNSGPCFSLMPESVGAALTSSPSLQVFGNGNLGRLTKWTGFTSTTASIGDSNIFEDKFGKVGIGTTAPTSLLTVQGAIETTFGGIKFPDGSVQTSSSQGALITVAHDASLTGNGTVATPLGVTIPLQLSGLSPVLSVTSTGLSASPFEGAIVIHGAEQPVNRGGIALEVVGGKGTGNALGGAGIFASGGDSAIQGGSGVIAVGASLATGGVPGPGLIASGGASHTGNGASGIEAFGGISGGFIGGPGVSAFGASAAAINKVGGVGIVATGGEGSMANGFAGLFIGDVEVQGNLSKSSGSFKIDHPLDPANKYLYHSFVESPDMMNIYNGVARLDAAGDAIVVLPDWFQALNKDFRYSLTAIGAPAPFLHVGEEVNNNQFRIAGGAPGMKVSWQVTGVRQDAYANANRIQVEEDKGERERGTFLHPEVFNQPAEKSVNWVRQPNVMQKAKEGSERGKQRLPAD